MARIPYVLDAAEYKRLLEELHLLRDVHTALRQLQREAGVQQVEARRLALARLDALNRVTVVHRALTRPP